MVGCDKNQHFHLPKMNIYELEDENGNRIEIENYIWLDIKQKMLYRPENHMLS